MDNRLPFIRLIDHSFNQAVTVKTDRKSTRLNSSHVKISYAVFCLKKKKERHSFDRGQTYARALPHTRPIFEMDAYLSRLNDLSRKPKCCSFVSTPCPCWGYTL